MGLHPSIRVKAPNSGAIVSGQTYKSGIEKTIIPKLFEVCGDKIFTLKNNTQGVPTKIVWCNGSVTYLMSIEQPTMAFEGTPLDWVWCDEPPKREIFVALWRGLMKSGGPMMITATPLDEPWIYDEIYVPGVGGTNKLIEVFEGSTYENIKYLGEKNIKDFESKLTSDEHDARINGRFRHLSGRVLKEYDPTRHLVASFDIPSHWPVWISIDPHQHKEHAVLFLAIAPNDKKYICNEIFFKGTIKDLGGIVLDLADQYNVVKILIDTSAQSSDWSKVSARKILSDCGVDTQLAQKRNQRTNGTLVINQLFKDNNLFVMEHCRRTIKELLNWVYKKSRLDPTRIMAEPEKKFDDMMDNLRYILVENPKYRGLSKPKYNSFYKEFNGKDNVFDDL